LNNFPSQEEQLNDIFQFDEALFEHTNKQKKFKCKICLIKVDDLQKHLTSFSYEKRLILQ
jgi:hypothetical protein